MKNPEWTTLSFLDNLNAAALKVGYDNIPIAWGVAHVRWKSVEEREAFLESLTNEKIVGE